MKRKTDNFSKFFNRKSNSAVKESIKQEKKAAKKERKEAIEQHFEKKRQAKAARYEAGNAQSGPGSKAPFNGPDKRTPAGGPGKQTAPGQKGGSSKGASASGGAVHDKQTMPYDPNLIPLNKYVAHSGICSRRDAAELIRVGKVLVNGKPVTEPGTKVSPSDFVQVNGKKVTISRNFVYILLNKPKDYITTTDDPQGRRTVLDLIRQATTERVYPVGRLDRNTSGVLMLTNDGELAQKLAHPSNEIKKIYHVTLDKALTKADFDKIVNGSIVLDDGPAFVDVIAYADSRDKTQIGLEIHSGRNRIVRRIFEHLGYDVRGLDRVMYAGLTKKNVQRGKWRLLTEKEIRILKYLNSSGKGSPAPKGSAPWKGGGTEKKNPADKFIGWDEEASPEFSSEDEESIPAKETAPSKKFDSMQKSRKYSDKSINKSSGKSSGKSTASNRPSKFGESFDDAPETSEEPSAFYQRTDGSQQPPKFNRPAAASKRPSAPSERPSGSSERPSGASKRPKKPENPNEITEADLLHASGEKKRPHGASKRPGGGFSKRPASASKRPYGSSQRPDSASKRPSGPSKRPYGSGGRPDSASDSKRSYGGSSERASGPSKRPYGGSSERPPEGSKRPYGADKRSPGASGRSAGNGPSRSPGSKRPSGGSRSNGSSRPSGSKRGPKGRNSK